MQGRRKGVSLIAGEGGIELLGVSRGCGRKSGGGLAAWAPALRGATELDLVCTDKTHGRRAGASRACSIRDSRGCKNACLHHPSPLGDKRLWMPSGAGAQAPGATGLDPVCAGPRDTDPMCARVRAFNVFNLFQRD